MVADAFTTIKARRARWLWTGRLPLQAVSALAGLQGLGKSTLATRLAADVTRGTLDGDLHGQPADMLIVSLEDAAATVVVPRFLAAGGDPCRAHLLKVTHEGADALIELPTDVAAIEAEAGRVAARLVIIDPITAALAASVDSHRDAALRRALAPLAAMAERLDLVVLIVAHLRKGGDSEPLYRVGGSIALTAATRSVLMLAAEREQPGDDQDTAGELLLAHAKSNHGPLAVTLRGRIDGVPLRLDDGDTIATSRWVDLGESVESAAQIFGLPEPREPECPERDDAEAFLLAELADGPLATKELKAAAAGACIAWATVRRAKDALDVTAFRRNRDGAPRGTGEWLWALPDQDAHVQDEHLERDGGEHVEDTPPLLGFTTLAGNQNVQGAHVQTGEHLEQSAQDGDLP